MNTTQYSLSDVQSGCADNWRNAIYIPCNHGCTGCDLNRCGAFMTTAPDGEPILIGVKHFERLTGQIVQPEECGVTMSLDAFRAAFSRYLLWELDHAERCPLRELDKKIKP